MAKVPTGLKPEGEVQGWAVKHLQKGCGLSVREQVDFSSKTWDKGGKIDCLGLDPRILHVGECKPGRRRRPLEGIFQLLMYRILIESDFDDFKASISQRGLDRTAVSRLTPQDVKYDLFLSAKSADQGFLKAVRERLGGMAEDITLVFLAEE